MIVSYIFGPTIAVLRGCWRLLTDISLLLACSDYVKVLSFC